MISHAKTSQLTAFPLKLHATYFFYMSGSIIHKNPILYSYPPSFSTGDTFTILCLKCLI